MRDITHTDLELLYQLAAASTARTPIRAQHKNCAT